MTCPHCGGNMSVNTKNAFVNCKYCGTEIVIKDTIYNQVTNNYIENVIPVPERKLHKREKHAYGFRWGSFIFTLIIALLSIYQVYSIIDFPKLYHDWFEWYLPMAYIIPLAVVMIVFFVGDFCESLEPWIFTLAAISYWGVMSLSIQKYSGHGIDSVVPIISGAFIGLVFPLLCALSFKLERGLGLNIGAVVVLWLEVAGECLNISKPSIAWHLLPIAVIAIYALFSSKDLWNQ